MGVPWRLRTEGFMALYKGFIPTISRQGPFIVVLFVTLEQVRKLFMDLWSWQSWNILIRVYSRNKENWHPTRLLFQKYGFWTIYDVVSIFKAKLETMLMGKGGNWKPAKSEDLIGIQRQLFIVLVQWCYTREWDCHHVFSRGYIEELRSLLLEGWVRS